MTVIAFIGLGNMGLPMAKNLLAAGHVVRGFDLSAESLEKLAETGGTVAASAAEAAAAAEVVVTMLPAGENVRTVYEESVFPNAGPGTLLIDCSTIDVDTARAVAAAAALRCFQCAAVVAPLPNSSSPQRQQTCSSPQQTCRGAPLPTKASSQTASAQRGGQIQPPPPSQPQPLHPRR